MARQGPWSEARDRSWAGARHDYARYPDDGYRDETGRPLGYDFDEARSFAREADEYDATPFGYGAGYGREGLRAHRRDWWDRARDELAAWAGDRQAERRREWDRIRGRYRGRGPRGYRRSDERIREDLGDRLTDDPWLDASDIEVTVSDREVTLAGLVDSRADKRRAEDIADAVSGVTHVQNNLRVRPEVAEHEVAAL